MPVYTLTQTQQSKLCHQQTHTNTQHNLSTWSINRISSSNIIVRVCVCVHVEVTDRLSALPSLLDLSLQSLVVPLGGR